MKALRCSLRWIVPSMVMLGLLTLGLQFMGVHHVFADESARSSPYGEKGVVPTVLAQSYNGHSQSAAQGSSASGRFGVALGNWYTPSVTCYNEYGTKMPNCNNEPRKLTLPNRNEMQMKSYRAPTYGLAHPVYNGNSPYHTFNVAAPYYLDAEANTIFVLYHFLGKDPGVDDSGVLQSNAPGQIQARLTAQGVDPKIDPNTDSYIWRRGNFKQWLIDHRDFDDGWGNWYGFYLLSEVDTTSWTKLTAAEYVLVIKDYVEFLDEVKSAIKSQYNKDVTPRIILSSPVLASSIEYNRNTGQVDVSGSSPAWKTYYSTVWNALTPHERAMVAYTSIDIFFGPPPGPDCNAYHEAAGCDYDGPYPIVQDGQLKAIANKVLALVRDAGQFFYTMTGGRQTLITQFGPRLPGTWGTLLSCSWCSGSDDDEKWNTTEWGNARLTQLVFRRLVQNVNQTKVIAWAYWGSIFQPAWTEDFSGQTWGETRHGVMWLAWNLLMTPENVAQYCPSCAVTNEVWPTRVGIVYIHAANGDLYYRDDLEAPLWWPQE